jgi:hypothetical protein
MYNKTNVHRGRYSPIKNGVCEKKEPYAVKPACERYAPISDAPSLAMVYPLSQSWRFINDGCEGFTRGTIFDELNKPFLGDKCKSAGGCK